GAASRRSLADAVAALEVHAARTGEAHPLVARYRERARDAGAFVQAYRGYCWPVASIDDLEIAPFHLLASEGKVHIDRDHTWHVETLATLCAADRELLVETPTRLVDFGDAASERDAIAWWDELTVSGG